MLGKSMGNGRSCPSVCVKDVVGDAGGSFESDVTV